MTLPFVSVIIPIRGQIAPLRLCLEALAQQTFNHRLFEVVIVNNGAIGNLKEFHEIIPNLTIVEESIPGCYRARNRGIGHAKGEIIAFTDADCLPQPKWLEKGVAALLKHGPKAIIGGRIVPTPLPGKRHSVIDLFQELFAFPQEQLIKYIHFSVTANLFTFKESFSQIGKFNEDFLSGGDYEWGCRAWESGIKATYDAETIVRHWNRQSLSMLLKKAIRVRAGLHQMRHYSAKGQPPHSVFWKLLKIPREKKISHQLPLFGILALLRTVSILEAARLMCGGKPRELDKYWGYCQLPSEE